jgi:hypothetical protein
MDGPRRFEGVRAAVLVRVDADAFAFWAIHASGHTYGRCLAQLISADPIDGGWELQLWLVYDQTPRRGRLQLLPAWGGNNNGDPGAAG